MAGQAFAFGRELRIDGAVLPAVRGRDEGARERRARSAFARSREDDVARLVTDEKRARHARRARRHVDDRDAVGQVIDDPDLALGAGGVAQSGPAGEWRVQFATPLGQHVVTMTINVHGATLSGHVTD